MSRLKNLNICCLPETYKIQGHRNVESKTIIKKNLKDIPKHWTKKTGNHSQLGYRNLQDTPS